MTYVLFAALVWQVVDFLRELTNLSTNKSAVVTQACAWVGGIMLIALAAHAAVTEAVVMPGMSVALGKLDWPSVVLVGLLASSLASTGVDVKQALDGSDSAAKPQLLD